MKPIYSTQSLPEAGLLRAILHDHGIEAMIDNESAPIPAAAPPTLLVDDENEEEALRLIREHLSRSAT
jgi:hypothetical protein